MNIKNAIPFKDENCVIKGYFIFSDNKIHYEGSDEFERGVVNMVNKLYPILAKEEIFLKLNTFCFKLADKIKGCILTMYTNKDPEEAYEIFDRIITEDQTLNK